VEGRLAADGEAAEEPKDHGEECEQDGTIGASSIKVLPTKALKVSRPHGGFNFAGNRKDS
jgi:hypothetical protein